MSNFYGTLRNERSKKSTRAANSVITACAQSWGGSVIVQLHGDTNNPVCDIDYSKGSATSGKPLWAGRLSALPLQFEKAQLLDRVLPALTAIADGNDLTAEQLHSVRAVALRFAMDEVLQAERGPHEETTPTA